MRQYDDAEGKRQFSLNIVQTKVDVLKRPNTEGQGQGASDEAPLGVQTC